jgi:hypothetical protein
MRHLHIYDYSGSRSLPLSNNRHVMRVPLAAPPITWNSALYITGTIKQTFTQLMNKHADSMGNLSRGRFDHDLSHSVHYTLVTELQCCFYSLHMCVFMYVTKTYQVCCSEGTYVVLNIKLLINKEWV